MQKPLSPEARGLVLGAVTDFLHYLNNQQAPIVVGLDYPPERLVDAFKAWAEERNVNINVINRPGWCNACKDGALKDENT